MKVLLLAAASPDPARTGQRLRYRQHLRGLTRAGARCGLVTFLRDPADFEGLARLRDDYPKAVGIAGGNRTPVGIFRSLAAGEPVHLGAYRSAAFANAVRDSIRDFAPDVVIAGNTYLAPLLALAPPGTLRVVDEQNDEVEIWELEAANHSSPLRRLFARANGDRLRQREREMVSSCDLTTAVSSADQARFEARGRHPVEVVPNGVETGGLRLVEGADREPDEILWTGTDAERNLDSLRWLAFDIWPRVVREHPTAHLTIAGAIGPAARRPFRGIPRLDFTGAVPAIEPFFRRASVFVAPFRLGGGTRLKILEAGSAGLAVVSTPAGVRGLDLRPGVEYLSASEPAEFAGEVVRLLQMPDHRRAIGESLRRAVVERHDVAVVGRRFAEILDRHRRAAPSRPN